MDNFSQLTKNELASYFCRPATYFFIVIFLILNQTLTFYVGDFFQRNEADLLSFFEMIPWVFAVFVSAIITQHAFHQKKMLANETTAIYTQVIARFFADWVITLVALLFTIPLWITLNYLGHPDNEAIMAGYLGCLLLGGAFAAVAVCFTSFIKTPLLAFLLSTVVCLFFLVKGTPMVLDYLETVTPLWVPNMLNSFSLLTHFSSLCRGLFDARTLIYIVTFIVFWLFLTTVILEKHKK